MTETEEPTTHHGEDARDPAREAAGETAGDEGAPREGDERRATGNPASAGDADEDSGTTDADQD